MKPPGEFQETAHKITCPKDCIGITNNAMQVFGPADNTDEFSPRIYTLSSSICASAIHAGIITNDEGGDVLIHLTFGRDGFQELSQNKINSKQTSMQEAAF